MKIRNGFVSNSSTSSFVIYGIYEQMNVIEESLVNSEEVEDGDIDSVLSDQIEKLGLNLEPSSFGECGMCYVGRNPCSIKDDETGKQFKESVKEDLLKLFKKEFVEKNIDFHPEIP